MTCSLHSFALQTQENHVKVFGRKKLKFVFECAEEVSVSAKFQRLFIIFCFEVFGVPVCQTNSCIDGNPYNLPDVI